MGRHWMWVVCLAYPALAVSDEAISPPEAQELTRFVRQECGFCHGLRLTGGLGSPLTAEAMRDRPIEYLEAVIQHGIPGTAMPGWAPHLTQRQVHWIAERLREGFPP